MKRLFVFLTLAAVLIGTTGCQSRFFGRRGARCRAETPPPGVAVPGALQNPAACGPGFSQPMTAVPSVVIPDGAVYTDGQSVGEQGIITSPMEGASVRRQVVPGSITIHDGSTVLTVPGPESAPLPNS